MLSGLLCSRQAHELSHAINKDAAEAVRAALQYETMHEEGDEDVGEICRHLTFTATTTNIQLLIHHVCYTLTVQSRTTFPVLVMPCLRLHSN